MVADFSCSVKKRRRRRKNGRIKEKEKLPPLVSKKEIALVRLSFKLLFTDLCFVLHLLCLGVCAMGGEGLQKCSDPGPGALSLSI